MSIEPGQATDFVRLLSAIEGLTWNPATHERVQNALYPPTRKVHVRTRDIDAVLEAAREGVLPEVSGDVASTGTTPPPAPEVVEVNVDIDPIEPTVIAPGLTAMSLAPTVWDDLPDGQHAVTLDGVVWVRRAGLWHPNPWYQGFPAVEILEVCKNPDDWAYDHGWPRKAIEEAHGPLTPITLPEADRG